MHIIKRQSFISSTCQFPSFLVSLYWVSIPYVQTCTPCTPICRYSASDLGLAGIKIGCRRYGIGLMANVRYLGGPDRLARLSKPSRHLGSSACRRLRSTNGEWVRRAELGTHCCQALARRMLSRRGQLDWCYGTVSTCTYCTHADMHVCTYS